MNQEEDVVAFLKEHGAVLDRTKKHEVWKFPNGRIFVRPVTPGDRRRGARNAMSTLRRVLNLKREVDKNAERRNKPGVGQGKAVLAPIPKRPEWKDKLKSALTSPDQHCVGFWLQHVPATPIWVILRCLLDRRHG